MNELSSVLVEITQQQLQSQQELSRLSAHIKTLHESAQIDVIASLPKLDADLQRLAKFNRAVSRRIYAVSH